MWCHLNQITISDDENKKFISRKKYENAMQCVRLLDWFLFHDYKHAIEIDENGHSDRNIDYEIKRQKAIEQELGCELIRIDPDKDFELNKTVN